MDELSFIIFFRSKYYLIPTLYWGYYEHNLRKKTIIHEHSNLHIHDAKDIDRACFVTMEVVNKIIE